MIGHIIFESCVGKLGHYGKDGEKTRIAVVGI